MVVAAQNSLPGWDQDIYDVGDVRQDDNLEKEK